jgi:hypothetical protein
MAIQTANQRQFCAPAAANNVTVTPSGVSWVPGAWASVIDPVDADCALTGVCLIQSVGGGSDWQFEVDIAAGTSGGGGETVIATVKGKYGNGIPSWMWLPIPVDAIPSGSRISARINLKNADPAPSTVSITYLKKPIVGTLQTSAQPVIVVPSASQCIDVNGSGSPWVYGAWATLLASAATDLTIVAMVLEPTQSGETFELQIGEGAAASEVVRGTLKCETVSLAGPGWLPLPNPITISSGSRIAARVRSNGGVIQRIGLAYQEMPL